MTDGSPPDALDGTVRLWEPKERQLLRTFEAGSGVTCVALPAEERRLVAGTMAGMVRIWDLDREPTPRGGRP